MPKTDPYVDDLKAGRRHYYAAPPPWEKDRSCARGKGYSNHSIDICGRAPDHPIHIRPGDELDHEEAVKAWNQHRLGPRPSSEPTAA